MDSLNPFNPADAALDQDSDGFSNKEEYNSGSDLSDPASNPGTLVFTSAGIVIEEGNTVSAP